MVALDQLALLPEPNGLQAQAQPSTVSAQAPARHAPREADLFECLLSKQENTQNAHTLIATSANMNCAPFASRLGLRDAV